MNKLLVLIIVLLTTFLSFVVYAVSQQANEQKSANEVIADIFNPQVEDLADQKIAEKRIDKTNHRAQPSADVAIDFQSENASTRQLRMFRGAAEPAPMQITITPIKDDQGQCKGYFDILFTNTSDEAVKILKPLDGSFFGWHQPHYKFQVLNSEDEELKFVSRCKFSGLWANTEFPENYLVEVPANESTKITGVLPYTIPESGEYKVSLEYVYDYTNVPASIKGSGEEPWNQPVEGVWEGSLKSNEITLQLKKND